uniref:Uncharacterized protein n=1 Tax=Rhipicephalus appendiculatus TaxID=34631 RepID=A0A131YGP8_RHIAP
MVTCCGLAGHPLWWSPVNPIVGCKQCGHNTTIHEKCTLKLYADSKQSRAWTCTTVSFADYPAIRRALHMHNAHNIVISPCL